MQKVILSSVTVSVLVFVVKYIIEYRVITERIKADPLNSFPPSAAWLVALPYAVITFIIVFAASWLVLKK
jgi:hypothetical protein